MNRRWYIWALAAIPAIVLAGEPLLAASERVKEAHAALVKCPSSVQVQKAYLAAFPSDFREFLDVFMPANFGQLYDGHEYIAPLSRIGEAMPKQTMKKLLRLGATGTWDADAPSYLQDVTLTLATTHTDIFVSSYAELTKKERKGLLIFLAGGIEGPDPLFTSLATKVGDAGNPALASRMLDEAKLSQQNADREHGR